MKMRGPDVLTTGEAAKLLRCSINTTIRLCDRGVIRSWKHAGSRFRLMLRKDVVAYAEAHKIPLAEAEPEPERATQ